MGDGQRFTYSSTASDYVGRGLFWLGLDGYEPETTAVFITLARSSRRIIDVGAHTGLFAMLACAARPDSSVIAFEPVPRISERLRHQIELNSFGSRCASVTAAVADHDGSVDLHIPLGEMPHSASLNPDGFHNVAGTVVRTPVVTLDSFCAGSDPVDLVKIDVEGFEDRVISGMRELLVRDKPAIVFEVLEGGPASAIESLLVPAGYQFYHLGATGPTLVPAIVADTANQYRNFAAVARPEHAQALRANRRAAS